MERWANQITVTDGNGNVLTLTVPNHAPILDEYGLATSNCWFGAFRSILYWLGFHQDTIEEYLPTTEIQGRSDITEGSD